ncbi:acyl-CoA dehydrogenase [Ramlibacter sp.]|uniref:acyl-CoA dehydrogenase n=1 Tax=Ramlibacter sp. TaxID=1917967 RepID=UPI003D0AE40C
MSEGKVELAAPDDAIGERATRTDIVDARLLMQFAALLDEPIPSLKPGDPVLPGRHWLFFNNIVRQSELKPDGIARKTAALPDVAGATRMWAGGRTDFLRPLAVGSHVRRETEVMSTSKKSGRSGDLVFVTLRHEIHDERGLAIVEEQDLLYRDPANIRRSMDIARPAPNDAEWSVPFTPDAIHLFRYSAITFNSHRMHFDPEYARTKDGYRGAVVHGPFLATLLMDLCARETGRAVRRLAYRGVSPLFDGLPAVLCGRRDGDGARVWAATADGRLALEGEIALAEASA